MTFDITGKKKLRLLAIATPNAKCHRDQIKFLVHFVQDNKILQLAPEDPE